MKRGSERRNRRGFRRMGAAIPCAVVCFCVCNFVRAGDIYWAQSFDDRIQHADSSGANAVTLLSWPQVNGAVGIAVDAIHGKVYWAQTFGNRIATASLDGSGQQTLLEWPELDGPIAIALDIAGGKIYWVQNTGPRIMRANLDGSSAENVVIWPDVNGPVGIAIDSAAGKIYWAQTFGPQIMRANLNGSSIETVLAWPNLNGPVAIAVDPAAQMVYWAQSSGPSIMRTPYSGTNVQTIVPWPDVDGPTAIALDAAGGKVYWAQSYDDRIRRADKNGGSLAETLLSWPVVSGATSLAYAITAGTPANSMSRYVTMAPAPAAQPVAFRVKLVSLMHPSPSNIPQNPAPNFSSFESQVRWVGPPHLCQESETPSTMFSCAEVQCTPEYQSDWASWGNIQLYGNAIVPSSKYALQSIFQGSDINNEAAYSSALTLQTGRWGDVAAPFQGPCTCNSGSAECVVNADCGANGPCNCPALTQPNIQDISAIVDKFKSVPSAPFVARADLVPNIPDNVVNISDVAACVDAFKNIQYVQPGPSTCP
ncbi:MAG: hypothetical protein HY287_15550 [Planctomycetes bacterium]|nr:hypothetical protein [Planctomycetota bacterium]MBI3835740.1 hypothetical protein [Planctomycetota bacterium]